MIERSWILALPIPDARYVFFHFAVGGLDETKNYNIVIFIIHIMHTLYIICT